MLLNIRYTTGWLLLKLCPFTILYGKYELEMVRLLAVHLVGKCIGHRSGVDDLRREEKRREEKRREEKRREEKRREERREERRVE